MTTRSEPFLCAFSAARHGYAPAGEEAVTCDGTAVGAPSPARPPEWAFELMRPNKSLLAGFHAGSRCSRR